MVTRSRAWIFKFVKVMPLFSNEIRPLVPLYVTMFLEAVGSGLVASILNVVARDDLGCSNMQVGIIWSSYNAALILGSLVMGYFSDIVRRKYVLMVTLFWVGCGYILTSFAETFEWFLVSRIVTGLCGGSFSIAASILSANLSSDILPFGIGRLATVCSLGFAIGPLLSTAITAIWDIDSSSPFYIQRLYFFVAAGVYGIAGLSASRLRASLTSPSTFIRADSSVKKRNGSVSKGLCLIWSSRYFSTSAVTAIYVTQVYMWREYLELNRIHISLLTTASGLAVSIVQGLGFPYLVKKIGVHAALLFGIACIAIACAAIGPVTVYTRLTGLHVLCLLVFWTGVACMEPGTVVSVSRHLKQSEGFKADKSIPLHTGLAMGITSAMKYAASLSIPTVAGLLYDRHRELVYYISSGICSLGVFAVIIAWRIYQAKEKSFEERRTKDDELNSVHDDTTVDGP